LLNQGASLRLRWGGAEREAILERGEASFKVRHDPEHAFRVTSGRESIVDLGTEFNVLDTPEMLVVTVREGSVRVSSDRLNPVDVAAAGQARIDRVEQRVSLSQVNPADAFAWNEGRLIYHNASLSEVVRDLNRYGETRIRIADGKVGDLRFSGVLVIDTSEKMVSQVLAFLPVGSDRIREEIVLRAR
jgi:transmembrane sensor